MLRLGVESWELIDILDLTKRTRPILSQIDTDNICILGGIGEDVRRSDSVIPNVKTGVVVKLTNPASDITFDCHIESYQKSSEEILSLVTTGDTKDFDLICFNQADDTITTIH